MIQLFATDVSYGRGGENIGIGRLKSFLDLSGKEVLVTYLNQGNSIQSEFEKININCSLYGFSVYQNNIEFFLKIMTKIKEINPKSHVVVGSKFVTTYFIDILSSPEMQQIDSAILGDGEYALLELSNCIDNSYNINSFIMSHKNIASANYLENKVPANIDINLLPWPKRSWSTKDKLISAYICDCHGCIAKCSFCAQTNHYSEWNGRSAEDLFNEIIDINKKFGIRHFKFTGGSFEDPGILGKEKIRLLCEMLNHTQSRFTFQYYLRADTFEYTDDDVLLLQLMRESGFIIALVGIESGNVEDLLIYNKRATLEQNRLTLALLSENDIYTGSFGFIMFNPYTTREKLRQNYRFLVEAKAYNLTPFVTKLTIYKNTTIFARAQQDGLLCDEGKFYHEMGYQYSFSKNDIDEIYNFANQKFNTDEMDDFISRLENNSTFIMSFYRFVNRGDVFREEMQAILLYNAKLIANYMYHLYEDFDIVTCEFLYDNFLEKFKESATRLNKVKLKLLKELKYHNTVI